MPRIADKKHKTLEYKEQEMEIYFATFETL